MGLVDVRAHHLEGGRYALQQGAPVGGRGGEDQSVHKPLIRFDLQGVDTYHTRPMSEPWSQLTDVDRLADRQTEVAFEIPVDQMPKVRERFASAGGQVRGVARFRREAGFRVADLEMSGSAQLVCQRCLEPMQVPVEASAHVALLVSEAEADRVPPEFETVHVPENRIRVRDLVEEELLLTLPISPLHEE